MTKPRVLLTDPIHAQGIDLLKETAEVILARGVDEDTLVEEVRDVQGIVVRARGSISRRVMENAPQLKVVGRHGVGVDNVDVDAATSLGIWVVNTPLATVEPVAEHAIGLMLGLSKVIVRTDRLMRQGKWREQTDFRGRELKGRTLGIVGAGRIGARVAEIACLGFNMEILYTDLLPNPRVDELGGRRCPLDELLRESDYVTLHVPLLPETQHLIGERELKLMKPTAYLLNLARGKVVDEVALIAALQSDQIAGAGLDVYETEPLPPDSPLTQMENVVITPHMSSSTEEALLAMAMVTKDIVAVLNGQPPQFAVNRV